MGNAQMIGSREEQQDAFGFTDKDDADFLQHGGVVTVVADGIGGHAHGGQASQLAVQAFLRDYQSKPKTVTIPDALYYALQAANLAVCEFAEAQGEPENCGTTLVAAVLHPQSDALYWIGVGDSRLYLLREDEWVQLTADSNCAGQIIKKMARGAAIRNEPIPGLKPQALTSFLGKKKLREIDRAFRPFPVHAGDRLVLCTDGLYDSLSTQEMLECLRYDPQGACERLVRSLAAKNLPNQDNATVTVLTYQVSED